MASAGAGSALAAGAGSALAAGAGSMASAAPCASAAAIAADGFDLPGAPGLDGSGQRVLPRRLERRLDGLALLLFFNDARRAGFTRLGRSLERFLAG
jgi:hypothetical protein